MAFTTAEIEDGSGVVGAIVYVATLAAIDPVGEVATYLSRRGFTVFTNLGTELLKEGALLRGTEFVENRARGFLLSAKTLVTQGLSMPRLALSIDGEPISGNVVHRLWLQAIYHATEYAAAGEELDRVVEDKRGVIRDRLEGVADTSWSDAGAVKAKLYPIVDRLLDPFLQPIGAAQRG